MWCQNICKVNKTKPILTLKKYKGHQSKPDRPNDVWVSDIIYMPLKGGKWAYLCTWMDLYSRQDCWLVTGRPYAGKSCQRAVSEGAVEAKGQAWYDRASPGDPVGSRRAIFITQNEESDNTFKLRQSMSRGDDPCDNA
ncbi:DDE-type integrase/transposase/recombinase [Dyadobacter alkalitolerans]|uniref:DDE-type integrase/transposase/recombinase n=1 Tax=Dyadobacter alkalitolerans TaxID=492736 RepID=UPI000683D7EA